MQALGRVARRVEAHGVGIHLSAEYGPGTSDPPQQGPLSSSGSSAFSILVTGMVTARSRGWLLIVGFAGHVPGLMLFFRRSLPSAARRENLAAIVAALTALSAAAVLGAGWRWLLAIWLVGHFAWGARVAWLLWRDASP